MSKLKLIMTIYNQKQINPALHCLPPWMVLSKLNCDYLHSNANEVSPEYMSEWIIFVHSAAVGDKNITHY